MSDKFTVILWLVIFALIGFFVIDMTTVDQRSPGIVMRKTYSPGTTCTTYNGDQPVIIYEPEHYSIGVDGFGSVTVTPLQYDRLRVNDVVMVTYSVGRLTGIKYTSGAEIERIER